MKSFVVFLRGINVNGIKIKMTALKLMMESLGYENVITVLATGNILVTWTREDMNSESHKSRIVNGLRETFGYQAFVVIKTVDDLGTIIEEANGHEVLEGYNHYVFISNEISLGKRLQKLFDTCEKGEKESLIISGQNCYWVVKKGETLATGFGKKVLGSKTYKAILTSRTINTIVKIDKKISQD